MTDDYQQFLTAKRPIPLASGLSVVPALNPALFPHQRDCVAFGLRQGRWGLFLDTGLGKTLCELEWCKHAAAATNGHALILAPLAVAGQIVREGRAFGYDVHQVRDAADVRPGINVCNYDRLDRLDADAFGAVALDESSILKSFTGKTTRALISAFRHQPFRLCATATPAPNDHMEIGTHAEFLGVMDSNEMLSRFFINETMEASQSWRLKRHAEQQFWDWMASWSRMAETPADLGHDATAYVLPPLNVIRHKAAGDVRPAAGALFAAEVNAANVWETKRQTANARAALAREVAWTTKHAPNGANTIERIGSQISTNGRERQSSGQRSTPDGESYTQPKKSAETQLAPQPERNGKSGQTRLRTDGCAKRSALGSTITPPFSSPKTALAPSAAPETQAGIDTSTLITATHQAASEGFCVRHATSASASLETIPKTSDAPHTISTATKMPALVLWCDSNDEQDALEREFGDLAFSIRGSDSPEEKERRHEAWLRGERPALISKSSIFGFGMNWQHCATMIFAGRSFSYEAWYQAVRRCWRFGQRRPVTCHLIVAEGEDQIGRVIDRKSADHTRMKRSMAEAMRRAMAAEAGVRVPYQPNHEGEWAPWLSAA